MTTSTHVQGVDGFSVHSYVEGVGPLRDALTARTHEVVHLPAHLVPTDLPDDVAALDAYTWWCSPTSGPTPSSWPRSRRSRSTCRASEEVEIYAAAMS